MIIWLNGAFGAGKTSAAYALHQRIPNSFLYDAEQLGYFIRSNIPADMRKGDFQQHSVWRKGSADMLAYIASKYNGVIIVPMTIVDADYFDEVVGTLRREGVDVHHFVLSASKETLMKRLQSRFEKKDGWAAQQIDRCLDGLAHPCFAEYIETDTLSTDEVVEYIAAKVGITLIQDDRSRLRKRFDTWQMRVKKI